MISTNSTLDHGTLLGLGKLSLLCHQVVRPVLPRTMLATLLRHGINASSIGGLQNRNFGVSEFYRGALLRMCSDHRDLTRILTFATAIFSKKGSTNKV